MAELGELAKHYDAFKARDTDVLGISTDTVSEARMTEQKFNIPFPVLSDSHRIAMRLYGTKAPLPPGSKLSVHGEFSYPTLILVDKTGVVRWIDILDEQSITEPVAECLTRAGKLQQMAAASR